MMNSLLPLVPEVLERSKTFNWNVLTIPKDLSNMNSDLWDGFLDRLVELLLELLLEPFAFAAVFLLIRGLAFLLSLLRFSWLGDIGNLLSSHSHLRLFFNGNFSWLGNSNVDWDHLLDLWDF